MKVGCATTPQICYSSSWCTTSRRRTMDEKENGSFECMFRRARHCGNRSRPNRAYADVHFVRFTGQRRPSPSISEDAIGRPVLKSRCFVYRARRQSSLTCGSVSCSPHRTLCAASRVQLSGTPSLCQESVCYRLRKPKRIAVAFHRRKHLCGFSKWRLN